jgi:hypothetical protein
MLEAMRHDRFFSDSALVRDGDLAASPSGERW